METDVMGVRSSSFLTAAYPGTAAPAARTAAIIAVMNLFFNRRSSYPDGAAGEYHGTESVFFEQVAALRLYAEHPAYDGQLLVVCFQNIAAAERVVDHLRRIEMLPQVDVEDLIMSRCAKNGTAEKPQSRFFAVALRYSVSKSCDSLCPFSSTRNDTRWRCSLEMSLCLKTI